MKVKNIDDLKKIKKANRLAEYEEAVDALFREQELIL